ncbi:MAG: Ig-like domain-containing protein [Lachnospiraceae bacterium]|nr:Ig-like domain-containing protein [Lachnospiraceae bacterium]
MSRGDKIKNGLKNIGWLVAFPVPVTKALATKKGGKLGRKAATIAATWAMYASLATAGVAAMVPNGKPDVKPDDNVIDSVSNVVDEHDLIDEPETITSPSGIRIQDHSEILGVGEEMSIIAFATPYNLPDSYAQLKWRSSDDSVATVDENGKITGIGIGTAEITATTVNGLRETFSISVAPKRTVPVYVSITSENKTFNIDDWDFYLYIDEDMDHTNLRPVTPTSEAGYFGDYNLVLGRKMEAYVTFNYLPKRNMDTGYASEWKTLTDEDLENGFTLVLPVNFFHGKNTSDFPDENIVVTISFGDNHSEAKQIEILGDIVDLQVGKSRPIYCITPDESDPSALIWTSSDESIATVDENGVVTGHKAGHVVITVTGPGGESDSAEFDVIEPVIYNMTVWDSYFDFGYTDSENWEMYYLVNGEKLDDGQCSVGLEDELTFTVVLKKKGDDSEPYTNSVTRTVTADRVSSGMDVTMIVNIEDDNGKGRQVEKEIRATLHVSFE